VKKPDGQRGQPRDVLNPPSKEALRQRKKRILDKYADGDAISAKDRLELAEIWAWQHRFHEMKKIHAMLIKVAIMQIAEEAALRIQARYKLMRALEDYLSVTQPPKK
jgi:hypothetical protein